MILISPFGYQMELIFFFVDMVIESQVLNSFDQNEARIWRNKEKKKNVAKNFTGKGS